jgi:hypothetical protein
MVRATTKEAGYSSPVLNLKGKEYCPGGMNEPPKE